MSRRALLRSLAAAAFAAATAASGVARAARPALYPDPSAAASDIDAALKAATAGNKRVLVDFGGNWCGDCIVLDRIFQQPENAALLAAHYIVVRVNVGETGINRNADIAERYGIPLRKGVPALAVLAADGSVVTSQKNGEFESMRRTDPNSINEFLTRWSH